MRRFSPLFRTRAQKVSLPFFKAEAARTSLLFDKRFCREVKYFLSPPFLHLLTRDKTTTAAAAVRWILLRENYRESFYLHILLLPSPSPLSPSLRFLCLKGGVRGGGRFSPPERVLCTVLYVREGSSSGEDSPLSPVIRGRRPRPRRLARRGGRRWFDALPPLLPSFPLPPC